MRDEHETAGVAASETVTADESTTDESGDSPAGESGESAPEGRDEHGTTTAEDSRATGSDDPDGGRSSLPTELVYRMLSDPRRRYAIHYLKQSSEAVPVRELAEQVAAWENDKPVGALTSQERKRVYISLYQSHLPTMDAEGIVEYDADRKLVALSAAARGLDIYLEVVPSGDIPWSLYYVGLAGVDGLLLLLAALDVAPFGDVPDLAWGAIVLVTFVASALAQTYYARRMRFGDPGPPPELQSER